MNNSRRAGTKSAPFICTPPLSSPVPFSSREPRQRFALFPRKWGFVYASIESSNRCRGASKEKEQALAVAPFSSHFCRRKASALSRVTRRGMICGESHRYKPYSKVARKHKTSRENFAILPCSDLETRLRASLCRCIFNHRPTCAHVVVDTC